MNYQYVAYTNENKIVKGTISVASEKAAEQALMRQGYQPITLKPLTLMFSLEKILPSLFKVKQKEIIMFSRQLATLLEAGISLVPALKMLQEQMSNRVFREIITAILDDLRAGSSFSDALAKHTKTFGELYCRLSAVGEQTGSLEGSLRQAASYIEKDSVAKKKVKRALTYPILVLSVAVVVVTVLLIFVLPSMITMFTSVNVDLPITTRLLISVTNFVTDYKLYLLAGMGAVVFGAIMAFRQPSVRYKLDRLLLTIPIIGPVNLMNEMSRFSRTIALLVHAGLPLPDIIDMARQTSNNRVVKDTLTKVRHELIQGQGLSKPMSKNKLFPPLLTQMVMVGEESGNLESTLSTVADSYESEADDKLNDLIALIEPAMTIGLALVVAFIALSVITPMYSILGTFG